MTLCVEHYKCTKHKNKTNWHLIVWNKLVKRELNSQTDKIIQTTLERETNVNAEKTKRLFNTGHILEFKTNKRFKRFQLIFLLKIKALIIKFIKYKTNIKEILQLCLVVALSRSRLVGASNSTLFLSRRFHRDRINETPVGVPWPITIKKRIDVTASLDRNCRSMTKEKIYLRTVPTIVIAHTFCASPDTRISYRQCLPIQGYFCAV